MNGIDPEATQLHHGHHVVNAFLIALNVGAIGSFFLYDDPWVHPVLSVADDLNGTNARGAALVVRSETAYEVMAPLSEQDIYNTVLIFGVLAREESRSLTGDYCRGLLLMRMNFYELNFRKEAFMCFYRSLEYFVANRLLRVKRLKDELRDLKRGLAKMGASQELVDELREVYSIRSSQVAHSQGNQRDVTFDEVLKTKVFLDFVLHKAFKEEANRLMQIVRSRKPMS